MKEFLSWLAMQLGVVDVTMWAISFFSTLSERFLLFIVCVLVQGVTLTLAHRRASRVSRFVLLVSTSFALYVGLNLAFPFDEYPFPVDGYLFPGDHPVTVALGLTGIVAIGARRLWVLGRSEAGTVKVRGKGVWVSAVVVPALAVALLNGWSLRGMARTLHQSSTVRQFAFGDFNGLELDPERGVLYAAGHGSNYLLAFDVRALDQAPRQSAVELGWPQSLAYNERDRELYVFNVPTRTLVFLDATTLGVKKAVPRLGVTNGDTWISWDRHTDRIIIASEEDDDGIPTVVLDRQTGEVVEDIELTLTNAFVHPDKSVYYMGFHEKIMAYDLDRREVVAQFDPGQNWFMERMELSPGHHELFVAATADSAVLRLHPETLALKGSIDTVFGVRTLAVDRVRNLLLTASLVSNMLEVIDLTTEETVGKYYVGPWLRTIAVDARRGVAYVSSIEGLFRVAYAPASLGVEK